jgi:hypothetical protein
MLAFVVAVATAYLFAVLMYTQLNLGNLVELGLDVTMDVRIDAALHDLAGMAPTYAPLIAVALLLSFAVTGLVLRWVPQIRTLGYLVGGFVAIFVMEALMTNVISFHILPVTRTTVGLLSQCLAGAFGGYVFVLLAGHPTRSTQ